MLENMFREFKEYEESTKTWDQYLEAIRYPEFHRHEILDSSSTSDNWFKQLSREASTLDGYYDRRRYR